MDRARTALARGAWEEALAALEEGANPDRPEWVQLKGRACYGSGDLDGAVRAFERLHALQLAGGAEVEAADAALTIALYLLIDSGLMAPVRAWVRRAERLLEPHPDAAPHALAAWSGPTRGS